jgi:hypothetical protein
MMDDDGAVLLKFDNGAKGLIASQVCSWGRKCFKN